MYFMHDFPVGNILQDCMQHHNQDITVGAFRVQGISVPRQPCDALLWLYSYALPAPLHTIPNSNWQLFFISIVLLFQDSYINRIMQ